MKHSHEMVLPWRILHDLPLRHAVASIGISMPQWGLNACANEEAVRNIPHIVLSLIYTLSSTRWKAEGK